MNALKRIGYLLGLPAILVVVWHLLTVSSDSFFVVDPVTLAQTFVDTWVGERFWNDVAPSLVRLAVGLVLAISLGIGLGLLIGSVRWLRALTEPVLEFLRAIPPPVLVPILMVLVGINNQMKVLVIVSGAIWPVLLNTVEGVRSVDEVLLDTGRVYRITGWLRVTRLVLPAAAPQMMAGIRQALSIGLILMVISEMFASSSGLGFTIVQFQRSFAVPEMWSGVVVLGLIGLALAFIFQFVERRVLRWYHGLREVDHAG
ncbi:ABC transporter permease [Knoellia sp. 3-2P3]|uniref:ABC transporter permease n=1 Tax=unclassified Knoellia TaxID=2618719 RepID=UPI0023DC025E|nr:ABC transporter permease [Knoellia sp. 3-2P3]MDF2092731.1 ABC transporter permease [Knoellia sp. 3-2P3]